MKRTFALIALTVGMVSIANAAPQANIGDAPENPLATPWSLSRPTYRFVDPGLTNVAENGVALATSNIIFLNNCQPSGCTISPGNENAAANKSSIVDQASQISAYTGSAASWTQVVSCVKATYAPFNVQVVDQRPASGVYHMAIVAGRAAEAGMQQGVLGVSPFTCGLINGGISFSFANEEAGNIDDICWTVSQETAHSWGLDHKFDNKDPMTYLQSGPSRKSFQNTDGSCGEYNARACSCGGSTMNSYKAVLATFGPNGPPTPPTVMIQKPANNAHVDAGFGITATAMDDISVSRVEAYIDGTKLQDITTPPYAWNAPSTIHEGNHVIKVIAYDIANTPAEQSVNVTYGTPCDDSHACAGTNVCVDGRCVAGADAPNGLGVACSGNTGCASNNCASDGTQSVCVESCTPGNHGCPDGFGCAPAGTGGVCFPGYDDGGSGGGCNATGGNGSLLLGLGLGALLITRKRRR